MNNEITLTDLFDVEMLQRIQDSFAKMTGIAAIITDADGNPVTKGSNFTDFCSKYTRKSTLGCIRCQQCDRHGAELALKVGSSVTYYCHAGLMDFAAPIMAGDKLVGCFVGGQVLTSPPDITKVMQVAAEIGVDLINYLQSIMEVPIIEKTTLENDALFLYTLTDTLSSIAYHKYIMAEANIEIERAANMKSDFLANMSHEIRTPMNAVIGMAEMALREEMTSTAKNYINQIKESGKTLLTIINDILDFSKIDSGKMDIINTEYEPMSVINDVSNIINTRIDKDNVELVLDINPSVPRILYGDSIRIKQIIINLANNAAKFTKSGQVLLKFDYERTSDDSINLLFSVEDTGIGIKPDDIEKIFQSFQQVDSKRNRNIEGTGLGLAISKRLLNLMNGDIEVESVYGKGSTFSFKVPQKIIDNSESIVLSEPEDIHTLCCLNNKYEHEQFKHDMEKFDTKFTDINSCELIAYCDEHPEILNDSYIFINESDFDDALQNFLQENQTLTAVISAPYDMPVNYDIPNVIIAHKPLSIMTLSAIYNHESLNLPGNQSSDGYYDFTAENADILIVDDNSINLTVSQGLLEPLNMNIDTALSGREAIEKISNKMYDLILMDHMMPEMDGVETTHIIRRLHKEYDNVPIIALTANAVGNSKDMFIQEGMNDFVAKPIEVRVLISKLRQWLPKEKIEKLSVSSKLHDSDAYIRLPHVPELNISAALKLVGSKKLYIAILKDYYQAIPKKKKLIRSYMENGDWHNYIVEVHALKSASKQIGADELSQKASELEAAGNANDIDKILKNTDELLALYSHYEEVLAPYFTEKQPMQCKPPVTKTILVKSFDEMAQAINDLDLDKMENVVNRLNEYSFNVENAKLYARLCDAVADMDPDACDAVIKDWEKIDFS